MRKSKVKAKLRRGEPVLLTTLHFTDPSLYEMTSLMGFDGVWMDMEHHGYSLETAMTLMRAARVHTADIMVRPAKGEFMRLGRMLEAGAQGLMYPRCDDEHEARELVSWAKFAPLGRRGFDGGNPDMPYCTMGFNEYLQQANDETFLVVQIESEEALGRVGEIAAVPGVDVLFFGPGDFSILAGIPGQFDHPKITEAMREISRAAAAAGKNWGMPTGTVDRTREIMDMGARFICHGADLIMVKSAQEAIRNNFAPLGFTFDGVI